MSAFEPQSTFLSRLFAGRFTYGRSLESVCQPGFRWQSLPPGAQYSLCLKYFDQSASVEVLPRFRQMVEASEFDTRLAALCVKLHCDTELYSEAYRALELCLLKRTREILRAPQGIKSELYRYVSDIRILASLWNYLDVESRRNTAAKHRASDEVKQLFALLSRDYENLRRDLRAAGESKFILALLEFAQLIGTDQHVSEVYDLFMRSSLRNDIGYYARFISKLKSGLADPDWPEWQHYLLEFTKWLEDKIPDEDACWKLIPGEQRSEPGKKLTRAELKIFDSVFLALELSGRTELARRLAEKIFAPADQSELLAELCARLLRYGDDAVALLAARKLSSLYERVPATRRNVATFIHAFLLLNDRERMVELRRKELFDHVDPLAVGQIKQMYSLVGDFPQAIAEVSQIKSESLKAFAEKGDLRALTNLLRIPRMLDDLRFLDVSNQLLNEVPQPRAPCGIVIVSAKDAHELNFFPILALRELKQRGYAIVPLFAGVLDYRPTGVAEIDELAGQLSPGAERSKWSDSFKPDAAHEWAVDYGARKIIYNDIDVYWGIREDLCCRDRRYSIDFECHSSQATMDYLMHRIEVIDLCLDKIAEVGKRLGLPVRFIVPYVHLGLFYYARQYIQKLSASQDISIIQSTTAYENYFTNFATEVSTTIAVRNMTRDAAISAAFFAAPDAFERYYQALPDKQRMLEEILQWIRQHRVQRKRGVQDTARLDFLEAERKQGKKVVGLLGKVLFDLFMPRGDGPVHADMRDWFDHTLAIAAKNDHVHLLIKPHPHEMRDEIALYPTEYLKDWLPPDLPGNIHFLGHDEFNLFELADVLDLALMWHGTSALELGVLGIPTVMSTHYGPVDFPVGHIVPQSRSHYEHLIAAREKLAVPPEVRYRSAALINYLRHPDVSTPYRYTCRGLTNKSVRTLRWFREDLEAYRARGDGNVTYVADRIAGSGTDIHARTPLSHTGLDRRDASELAASRA